MEARLDEPVPYLESLRCQLGTCQIPQPADGATSRKPSEKKTKALPAWERRDRWLLIGDPAGDEGMLDFGLTCAGAT